MGLDLALGGLVLVSAIRGWLKGFVAQAIRLVGLVAAVYAAAPVRDQIRPYVAVQFPTIRPELLDKILWWASGVGAYFVIVGIAGLLVAVSRRQTFGMAEPNRGDQFAGFGLGLLKGLLVASFAVAGLQKYAEPQLVTVSWAEDQKKESFAWKWNADHKPAAVIWRAAPVQHFVQQIQKMGLAPPKPSEKPESGLAAEKPVQTASRTPKLSIGKELATRMPRARGPARRPLELRKPLSSPASASAVSKDFDDLDTTGVDPEVAETVRSILERLERDDQGP